MAYIRFTYQSMIQNLILRLERNKKTHIRHQIVFSFFQTTSKTVVPQGKCGKRKVYPCGERAAVVYTRWRHRAVEICIYTGFPKIASMLEDRRNEN